MADEETKQNEETKQDKPDAEAQSKSEDSKGQLLPWIIMATFIITLGVAGFFLGSKLGSFTTPVQASAELATEKTGETGTDLVIEDPDKAGNKGWYYDLEPIATNLSDPGSTRYVRAVLTLEMRPEADPAEGKKFLDEQKPVIANILNIYFAGLTVEDINSDKDMRRIQYELLEIFNETFYKNSKPLIQQILFREFGLQ